MANDSNEITVGKKLQDIFNEGIQMFDEIEDSSLMFNSPEFQNKVKKCIGNFEDSTRLVSLIGMFSSNEMISEVSTEDLKYLLLPYFLGQLCSKVINVERADALKTSEIYYKDFLKRCEEYEIIQSDSMSSELLGVQNSTRTDDDKMRDLLRMANQRNSKLEQYRKMKELEKEIVQLKLLVQKSNVDDEIKREFYMKTINRSILKSKEELISLEQELEILKFRKEQISSSNDTMSDNNHKSSVHSHKHNHAPKHPLKPIIITRDVVQKQIFGMGYPSLPVMSVNDFYEERVASGIFPNAEQVAKMNAEMLEKQLNAEHEEEPEDPEKLRQEELVDNDDDENLARLRARDEYKDVVRRGDGNRYNRS